ncbi:MAG: hypothetical protein WC683_15135 [bacterium]
MVITEMDMLKQHLAERIADLTEVRDRDRARGESTDFISGVILGLEQLQESIRAGTFKRMATIRNKKEGPL